MSKYYDDERGEDFTPDEEDTLPSWEQAQADAAGVPLFMETIYFQPKGIKPQYCEAGIIHESDPEHIWYLDEPCRILISEVKIIPKENVTYDKKSRLYLVQQSCL